MIAVTGASGLLGQIIVGHLVQRNFNVMAIYNTNKPAAHPKANWVQADINDVSSLLSAFKGATTVVHAAALVSFHKRDKAKLFSVNVDGTANVVNASLAVGVSRLIHISSVAALGKPLGVEFIDETTPWSAADVNSNYGLSKKLAEQEIFRGEAEGLSTALLNPSVILSSTNFNQSSGRLFDYVRKENLFFTKGHLNYVDARDVAHLTEILVGDHAKKGRFIANAGHVEWRQFFEEVAQRLGKKAPTIGVPPRMVYVAAILESIKSAISGKEPLVTFESARIANQKRVYSNKKTVSELNFSHRLLHDTLNWCCTQ